MLQAHSEQKSKLSKAARLSKVERRIYSAERFLRIKLISSTYLQGLERQTASMYCRTIFFFEITALALMKIKCRHLKVSCLKFKDVTYLTLVSTKETGGSFVTDDAATTPLFRVRILAL